MKPLLAVFSTLLLMSLSYPGACYDQPFQVRWEDDRPAWKQRSWDPPASGFLAAAGSDAIRADRTNDSSQEKEYRPAREIKRFSAPTIGLRGTAQSIGLDSAALAAFLEGQFLREFAFLQADFAFDKPYETWQIGFFGCEAWTVGNSYPIAFHVECAGGSMDEPRHWQHATLGYGPKDKIVDIVKNTLDSIVAEYAVFVRKAKAEA
jgi:hypothetical protein